jgi:hypothetical protein
MSYRCRNGAVLPVPAFMIAISPAWSCSTGVVTSDATAARPNPRASAIEASASRRRAAVSDAADPSWRARALSVYRFWRDLGYAIGALAAGLLDAIVGFAGTIAAIGVLTFLSGLIVAALMKEQPR